MQNPPMVADQQCLWRHVQIAATAGSQTTCWPHAQAADGGLRARRETRTDRRVLNLGTHERAPFGQAQIAVGDTARPSEP